MTAGKLSTDEKREALSLVIESQTFSRSDRLKNLLRFLCEAEIEGRSDELNEYAIATEALGRKPDFSPGEDSSVRSRAYELRRKLERFYAGEAPDAELRIEIPKGSYHPRFTRIVKLEEDALSTGLTVAPIVHPSATVSGTARRPFITTLAAFVAGMILTAAGLTAWNVSGSGSRSTRAMWTPELESLWKPMIDSKAPILICFQTRLFFRVGPLNVRDWRIDRVGAIENSEALMKVKQFFNVPQLYENLDYIDFGAANAVFQLSKLLGTRKQNMFARRSADVSWDDLMANNVIIMGKPEADPTVSHWLAKGKFLVTGGYIRNLEPAPGEPTQWQDDSGDGIQKWVQKYALITLLPGPRPGNWVLSMSGSGSEHPWAMSDYLTDPDHARDFIRHLKLPSGRIPRSYQVVIRAEFKSQMPVKVAYVAHRALEPL